ncbi:MAG: glycosyltransferase family 2 protein [Fimbriimonas ginsengisoli]|uniref:Glycosyltransferase family 2 protein n=1 Tax=Fimbriimonas ginsengisoli TaxID=1005039 RepID=A0A931PXA6_FIMGI|nr:glycosyltransferase family 2 protein [Fimbriimonas ginsengisoli]
MLSLLIVNWNTRERLRACLRSIGAFLPAEPVEVIVVDNASSDGSADMVAADFPQVNLIRLATNTGYAHGNNAAFAAARGEWLLTLNPDTEVLKGTLQEAIERLRAYQKAGCLGGRLVGTDGRTQRSVRGFPSVRGIFGDLTGLGRVFPRSGLGSYRLTGFDYEAEQPAPQPMGTFLLFRREAFASVDNPSAPFDESFPIFFNEVDLLWRMRGQGWACVYAPSVRVLHHGGESTRQMRPNMIWESHRSLVRFLRKHHGTKRNSLGLRLLEGFVMLGALVRARGYYAGFRA